MEWATTRENLSSGFGEQQRHRRRLISAFVICFLEFIISKLATSEISLFKLASVDEATGLRLVLSKTLKTGFVTMLPILDGNKIVHI